MCGVPVVNAGVGGAGIRYFDRHALEILGNSNPKLIVLAIGINDAHADTLPTFEARYRIVVAKLSRVAPVMLATIAPIENGPLTIIFDQKAIPLLNLSILSAAREDRVIRLDQKWSGDGFTTDGIHLNPRGYAPWVEAITAGIVRFLDCGTNHNSR